MKVAGGRVSSIVRRGIGRRRDNTTDKKADPRKERVKNASGSCKRRSSAAESLKSESDYC